MSSHLCSRRQRTCFLTVGWSLHLVNPPATLLEYSSDHYDVEHTPSAESSNVTIIFAGYSAIHQTQRWAFTVFDSSLDCIP